MIVIKSNKNKKNKKITRGQAGVKQGASRGPAGGKQGTGSFVVQ